MYCLKNFIFAIKHDKKKKKKTPKRLVSFYSFYNFFTGYPRTNLNNYYENCPGEKTTVKILMIFLQLFFLKTKSLRLGRFGAENRKTDFWHYYFPNTTFIQVLLVYTNGIQEILNFNLAIIKTP